MKALFASRLCAQRLYLITQRIQLGNQFRVAFVGHGRFKRLHIERAIWLEFAFAHLVHALKALTVNYLDQFLAGQRLAIERLAVNLSVANENGCPALQNPRKPRRAKQHPHHQPVDGQQPEGPNQAPAYGVVVSDDDILHRVRKRQQHHQVKRVQLRQLALAKDTQQHHQNQVDNYRASQLLQNRKRHLKHVVEDQRMWHENEDSGARAQIPAGLKESSGG